MVSSLTRGSLRQSFLRGGMTKSGKASHVSSEEIYFPQQHVEGRDLGRASFASAKISNEHVPGARTIFTGSGKRWKSYELGESNMCCKGCVEEKNQLM